MKQIYLILFFLSFPFLIQAQNGNAYYKKQLTTQDDGDGGNEIVNKALKQLEMREYKLSFTKNSANYSLDKKLNLATNPLVETFVNGFADFQGQIHYNLQENIRIHEIDISGSVFLIKKNNIEWSLTKDTLRIDNYLCYKATTTRVILNSEGEHKLNVTAWYTPEIPLALGPDGYCGLPGLILQLENNGTLTTLKRIENMKQVEIPTYEKGKKLTEDEFNTMISERFENRKDN